MKLQRLNMNETIDNEFKYLREKVKDDKLAMESLEKLQFTIASLDFIRQEISRKYDDLVYIMKEMVVKDNHCEFKDQVNEMIESE